MDSATRSGSREAVMCSVRLARVQAVLRAVRFTIVNDVKSRWLTGVPGDQDRDPLWTHYIHFPGGSGRVNWPRS